MSQKEKEKFARENHSEIERRRRNKMTAYITELSDMVPTCNALARKPDKLTILRMAVTHMKSLRGAASGMETSYKPSFLTDQELKHLVLEAADGFLFVTSCESGQVLYVADTLSSILSQPVAEWSGRSIYELIHPDDINKIREQLSLSDSQTTGRVLDMKTGTVKKEGQQSAVRGIAGSRRAFICRMRCGQLHLNTNMQPRYLRSGYLQECQNETKGNYATMHVTGFIRTWPPAGYGNDQSEAMDDLANRGHAKYALVAVARLQINAQPATSSMQASEDNDEFVSRHNIDGTFTFVDLRVTNVLGYEPKDLLSKLPSDFYHPEDMENAKNAFAQVSTIKGQIVTMMYRFLAKNGEYILIRTSCFAFQNPYNNEIEYVVCTNTLVKPTNDGGSSSSGGEQVVEQITPSQQQQQESASTTSMYNTPPDIQQQSTQHFATQQPTTHQGVKTSLNDVQYSPQQQIYSSSWNHQQSTIEQQHYQQQSPSVAPYQHQPINIGAQHAATSGYSPVNYQQTPSSTIYNQVPTAHLRDNYQQQEQQLPSSASYTSNDYNSTTFPPYSRS